MGLRRLAAVAALTAAVLAPGHAGAAGPTAFGGRAPCAPQDGIVLCQGLVASFDGVPLDVNLGLPAGGGANLPLVVFGHGWGSEKVAPTSETRAGTMKRYVDAGYAVLSATARGFNGSCGTPAARLANPVGCAQGWIHLDDWRYEARDVQHLAGLLADEGTIDGQRIGVTGESYGGGLSMELAALEDRVSDGTDDGLKAWTSPAGKPMRIAAAAPIIPWSDLTYSLLPNGRHLDYTLATRETSLHPLGVLKQSYVSGLIGVGATSGTFQLAPDPSTRDANLPTWFARTSAGEPYDGDPTAERIAGLISDYHSPYAVPPAADGPAPMFISNGWTDDLFPVDEALRIYNRTRARFPATPLALMFFDFGHARGTNKEADNALLAERIHAWMDRHVKGDAHAPAPTGVTALTQTCPREAPSGGPYTAPTWAALHPGEVRFAARDAVTVAPTPGDPDASRNFDPIAGGDACAAVSAAAAPGTAAYQLPKVTEDGYTVLGSPTVIADLTVLGANAQLVARLLDVAPDGATETLVARGVLRPDAAGRQVFQLHPAGWRFAPGHTPKLELLGQDAPYLRPSNGAFSIAVSNLELRLPVHDAPDCRQVLPPAAPVVPAGQQLAPDVAARRGAGRVCGKGVLPS
jgi:predicted acyl esterase